jgi:hypothetical protein
MGRAQRTPRGHLAVTMVAPLALLIASVLSAAAPAGAVTPASPTWSSLSTPSGPPGLSDASEAYDPANQTVVLFGGLTSNGAPSSATWVWNGSTWSQAVPQIQGPGARSGASLAFSQTLNQLILFGGMASTGLVNDTWAWNGQSWVALTPVTSPPVREDASLAVDANGNLVLFGGTGAAQSPNASAQGPSGNTDGAAGADAASTSGATDTAASTNLEVLADTWTWDGSNWSLQSGAEPPARTGATLTWDPALGASVLFGGSGTPAGTSASSMADTWTWDGSAWTEAVPATSPPARAKAVADYAAGLGGVVVTTGSGTAGALDDTWSYDGTTWNPVAAATPPADRSDAAAAWDAATQQLVVFGGLGTGGNTLSDTVVLTADAPVTTTTTTTTPPGGSSGGGSGPSGSTTTTTTTTPGGSTTSSTTSPTTSAHPSTTSTTTRSATSTSTPSPTTATGGTTSVSTGGSTPASTGPATPTVQTVHGGSLVTLLGSGFRPATSITITFHSKPYTVGRVTADASGSFSATVTVPTDASPGSHHLVATGMSPSGRLTSLVTPIRVVALQTGGGDGTPRETTIIMVAVAVVIPIATWSALAFRSRRRNLVTAP